MRIEALSKEAVVEVNGGYAASKPPILLNGDGSITINVNNDEGVRKGR